MNSWLWSGRKRLAMLLFPGILSAAGIQSAQSTPLIDAVKNCRKDQIKTYLAEGTGGDVNASDEYGFTAAMWDIQRCDAPTLQLLLDQGATLPPDRPQFSAIIEATKHGRNDIISLLLAHHYSINSQDHFGNTALMWAVSAGRVDTEKVLLAAPGIDMDLQDKNLQTALIKASQQENIAALSLLLAHQPQPKLNIQDKAGYTALIWAAHDGNLRAVQALLAAHADKTIRGKDNFLAKDVARRRNYPEVVQALQ